MRNDILQPVLDLRSFILFSAAAAVLLTTAVLVMLEKKKNGIGAFGMQKLFLGRTGRELLLLSLGLLEVVYVTAMLLYPVPIGRPHVVLMALLCLAHGLFSRSLETLISDVLCGAMEMAALLAGNLLRDYMQETGFDWYIMLIRILLALFLIQYSFYHLLKGLERMLRRNEKSGKRFGKQIHKKTEN